MPALKSPQREKFCQQIVKGGTQSDAYRVAFPRSLKWKSDSVNNKSSALMGEDVVAARVAELRAPVIAKIQYGLEEAMLEAAQAFVVSAGKENGGAMVAAVTLKAKLQGLLVERKIIDATFHEATLDDLI